MNANTLVAPVSELGAEPVRSSATEIASRLSREAAAWSLIAVLAWMQFPLGSNRPWSWSLLVLLTALVWVVWLPSAFLNIDAVWRDARRILVPGLMMIAVLAWAAIQSAPWTPASMHNGVWQILPAIVHHPVAGAVSVNPFETLTETMKLASYVALGFLAYGLGRDHGIARRIFVAIAVIGVGYALYGMYLSAIGSGQSLVLDGQAPPYGRDVTGAFVSKNSFATFDGMALTVCILLAGSSGRTEVVVSRGPRQLLVSLVQFLLGPPLWFFIGAGVLFTALALADSRAGLIATLASLLAVFVCGVAFAARRGTAGWAAASGVAAIVAMLVLFSFNGASLEQRFDQLVETNATADLRPVMWSAATQSIYDHPWFGTGLGTFRDVYPLYADRFLPYIVDRVHSDYLELALGLGIPGAIVWVAAIVLLLLRCLSGIAQRRRRRVYAVAAVGATLLVGVHSLVDFSLQMPAVAALYAAILGVGVAQSFPTEANGSRAAAGTKSHAA